MTKKQRALRVATAMIGLLVASGCQTDSREQLLKTGKSQVQLRSFQSRAFDTADKQRTLRTVVATLQDLNFVVDKADAVLGSVTASKLDHTTASLPYQLRMTVTVRPRGRSKMVVRANATYNITPVEDPEPYQQFFAALSKSLFLEANRPGGADYPVPQSPSKQAAAPPSGPTQTFASRAARDAWHDEAKRKVDRRYQRLLASARKKRYRLRCDESPARARTQACQDVTFQIRLLREAKGKDLAAIEQQYRQATVADPTSRRAAAPPSAPTSQKRPRDEILLYWHTKMDQVKAEGQYEDCENLQHGHASD